jgi:hypothetical protein
MEDLVHEIGRKATTCGSSRITSIKFTYLYAKDVGLIWRVNDMDSAEENVIVIESVSAASALAGLCAQLTARSSELDTIVSTTRDSVPQNITSVFLGPNNIISKHQRFVPIGYRSEQSPQ